MAIRKLEFYCLIANQYFPVLSVSVSYGSNGSLSTASGKSSLAMLRAQGIDIYSEAQSDEGAGIDVYAGYDGNVKRLFSGVLDEFDLEFDGDVITFSGRDHGASMADTKEVITGINYKNQTVGQIVEQIAKKFDLKPKVTDPGIMAGAEQYDNSHYMPHGQQYWSMLQDLARECGYECFVNPAEKELFFGPAEDAAGDALECTYAAEPGSNVDNPIDGLRITYQPRQNGNVEVQVVGLDPIKGRQIKSKRKAKAKSNHAKKTKAHFVVGKSSGKQTAKSGGTKPSARPVVVKRRDGITKEKADMLAESMAKDIAKRQVVVKGKIEGTASVQIHSKLTLNEDQMDLMGFDSLEYIISQVTHNLDSENEGWTTDITALTKPEIEE